VQNKLAQLLTHCKCGVYLTVNVHRDYYQSAEDRLSDLDCLECPPRLDSDIRNKIIETDTLIELQFYPDTPIGSYSIYHYDLDAALDKALNILQ
jgi:hypothetical protein